MELVKEAYLSLASCKTWLFLCSSSSSIISWSASMSSSHQCCQYFIVNQLISWFRFSFIVILIEKCADVLKDRIRSIYWYLYLLIKSIIILHLQTQRAIISAWVAFHISYWHNHNLKLFFACILLLLSCCYFWLLLYIMTRFKRNLL